MVGRQGPPRAKTLLTTGVFAQRRPLLDEPHDTAACSVPRAGRQTGRGHVRPGTGEFRRRCRAAQGSRAGVRPRQGVRPVSGRQACAGEDSAHARRPDRPAGLRHRVRPSGRERCRPPRRGSHPQAAAGAGPGHRRAPGVATDAVAIRERCGPGRLVSDGTGAGRERHRAAPATPAGAGAADHDRSGPDRRPDARGATARLLQRVSTTRGAICRCWRS